MKDSQQSEAEGVAGAVKDPPSSEPHGRAGDVAPGHGQRRAGDADDKGAAPSLVGTAGPAVEAEVPGPEDAWLRGGTDVPEGTTTEAASERFRHAHRVEDVEERPARDDVRRPERRESPSPVDVLRRWPELARRPRPPRQAPPPGRDDRKPMRLDEVRLPDGLEEGESDPFKRALALFSRIGSDEGEGGTEGATAGEGRAEAAPQVEEGGGEGADRRSAAEAAFQGGQPGSGTPTGGNGQGAPAGKAGEGARERPRSAEGRPEARRSHPSRPIYTLQDIHERTGIPYATLALYAVSYREAIPFLGERHSPAYPREGLEEFCRLYAEKNPGWQRPAEGSEPGWDDEAALAARLQALGEDQERLATELRGLLAELRRPWQGEAEWS